MAGSEPPVVLLVAGDRNLRESAARGLAAEGFDVIPASHGGHAWLACLAGQHVDVLVTEMRMADISGPRLARRIRRCYPGLPAVYLGEDGIERPVALDDLVRQVRNVLGQSSGVAS